MALAQAVLPGPGPVQLWADPVPVEMLLRTEVNLESGHATVRDTGAEGV